MKVILGRGSIVVEWPGEDLKRELSRFRRGKDGSGEYEELYAYSEARNRLVTMPGFAERVKGLCEGYTVRDERIPIPDPDIQAARSGIEPTWHKPIIDAIRAGGGVVAVPDMIGVSRFAAAVLRAFPRNALLDRGTPMSLIAARDVGSMNRIAYDLRRLVPERNVKTGPKTDCEDVVVATYGDLIKLRTNLAGVFVGEVTDDFADKRERVEGVSCVRNAARWGVMSSPFGGCREGVDLAVEGLFGNLVASMTYDEAVYAELAAPVTVCWIPCPRPNAPLVSASEGMLESIAHGDPRFVRIVSEIMARTPDGTGCLMYGSANFVKAFKSDAPKVCKQVRYGIRNVMLDRIASGEIRKAVLVNGYVPQGFGQGVVVSTSCGGADTVGVFPWCRAGERKKVYVVDFSHGWDVHNGRPGRLVRNDEARERRYADLGFDQIRVEGVDQLPFIGG